MSYRYPMLSVKQAIRRRKKKGDDHETLIDPINQSDSHHDKRNSNTSNSSRNDDDFQADFVTEEMEQFEDQSDNESINSNHQDQQQHHHAANRNAGIADVTEDSHSTGKTETIWDDQEKDIYESQLLQLQEQLVSAMIENQALASQLEGFKNTDTSTLHQQLQVLQAKNAELERLMKQSKDEKEAISYEREIHSVPSSSFNRSDATLEVPAGSQVTPFEKAREVVINFFYDFIADFLEDVEEEAEINPDGQQLSVKRLKENMRRCARAYRPFSNCIHSIQDIVLWRNPPLSILIFLVYMYCIWHGQLLTFILGLFILQLTINYLHNNDFQTGLRFFPFYNGPKTDEKTVTRGLSDKFQIVLQIARKVQNFLGSAANIMEKITNFMLWKEPDGTKYLLKMLCLMFAGSILLSSHTFYLIIGVVAGLKLFITTPVYHNFPKVRHRYDTIFRIWNSLPTNAEIEERDRAALIARRERKKQGNIEHNSTDENQISLIYSLFSLPASEKLIEGWESGWRCVFVSKERSIPSYKNGRLYLTDNYICYQRVSVSGMRNVKNDHFKIALSCITNVKKAKQLFFLPGTGTSLKIYSKVEFNDAVQARAHLFGILYRDEAYDSIMKHGRERNLPWAT
ncbi:GRAM domain-containing protein 4 [Trichoplax sp. H2]|nr:GRAM domain-containing protein 4 [Trichoplax sp. H2]|eukprot:RDD42906.1 GRAM domain-containing protein 4 [Trichoplax sp. H2]